ncbi:MAG: lamin tail domain-containing protein [Chloroflexi bacterium]|nr:lamin tail domain-containing protein [Chloroflexota bacterium]
MKGARLLDAALMVTLSRVALSLFVAPFPTPSPHALQPTARSTPANAESTQTTATPANAIIISALVPNGYEPAPAGHPAQPDEAFQLTNRDNQPFAFGSSEALRDEDGHKFVFPTITVTARSSIWLANDAAAFVRQFGFSPTLVYGGAAGGKLFFKDSGGSLQLITTESSVMDSANDDGDLEWPEGSGSPTFCSMERRNAGAPDQPINWASATSTSTLDGASAVCGTPRARNSTAVTPAGTTLGVVINEVAWGGTQASASHEWIELYNNLSTTVTLTDKAIRVAGGTPITLSGSIAPKDYFLITRGFSFSNGPASDLVTDWNSLPNSGAVLQLTGTDSRVLDTLVYGNGSAQPSWNGPALQPYTVNPAVSQDGLMLMRKMDPASGLPTTDTDRAEDWINDASDTLSGRRGAYPGWDLARFATPVTATGSVTIAIAPDNSFNVVSRTLAAATRSIDIEMYTFEHARLADLLALKASQGITVRVLLDGSPGGGMSDQEKWVCQRIQTANSGCWFMSSDDGADIRARYPSLHSKFVIVDGRRLIVGSENFSPNSLPDDDKQDGTAGQRGMLAVLDAATLVARAQQVFDADIDQAHRDIVRWCSSGCKYGAPAPGFSPDYGSGGISYTVRFGAPLYTSTPATMELATSPESNLRDGGIMAQLNKAGTGDTILLEQLDEAYYWGASGSNPTADPNPRLAAVIGAATRGASVRVLLDSFYDHVTGAGQVNPRSNTATAQYLNNLARANRWDLRAVTGNPTGRGIHNKLIAVQVGKRKYVQIGSWNGSEISAKSNREMTVLIESASVYDYVASVFFHDFWMSQPVFVPLAGKNYQPPIPVIYPLISEVMVDPIGSDSGHEWVELYNPTNAALPLNGYKLGDAEVRGKFGEGMYRFPVTASLPAKGTVIVAADATTFSADYGIKPNFAINSYDPAVPALIAYTAWASGTMNLNNAGDQVVLLGPADTVVDAMVWISDSVAGTRPFSGAIMPGHTLERYPSNIDTNDCNVDFHDQPFPSPGTVP